MFEGQVVAEISNVLNIHPLTVAKTLFAILQEKGDIFSFQQVACEVGSIKFIAEYADTRKAVQAVAEMDGAKIGVSLTYDDSYIENFAYEC